MNVDGFGGAIAKVIINAYSRCISGHTEVRRNPQSQQDVSGTDTCHSSYQPATENGLFKLQPYKHHCMMSSFF